MKKIKDMRNEIKVLDIAALVARTKALNIDINDLVLDKNTNKLKDLKSISKKRKELARVLTVLNQKEMIASLEPKTEVKEDKHSLPPSEKKQSLQSKDLKAEKGGKK